MQNHLVAAIAAAEGPLAMESSPEPRVMPTGAKFSPLLTESTVMLCQTRWMLHRPSTGSKQFNKTLSTQPITMADRRIAKNLLNEQLTSQ